MRPDRPAEVRLGLGEVEVGERPVLGLAGEPEVGEVVAHVGHDVRLVGDQILEGLDPGGQDLGRRVGRRGRRGPLAAAHAHRQGERERAGIRRLRVVDSTSPRFLALGTGSSPVLTSG